MKRILAIVLTALLFLSAIACGKAEQPSESVPESTAPESTAPESTAPESTTEESPTEESPVSSTEIPVKGTVKDFGRLSVLVPEGWEPASLSGYQTGFNVMLVKGKGEDFMTASSASILYCLPVEMAISARGFYENSHSEGEFDLGGRHWEAWSATIDELSVLTAESVDEYEGSIFFTLSMPQESSEKLAFEDPDVRAILESIVVVPTVDVEWITLKDGVVYAKLPEVEGYTWKSGGSMYTKDFDVLEEVDGSLLTLTPNSGSGAFSVDLSLDNEDGSRCMGEAKISIHGKDAKADAVYEGTLTVYDEPKEREFEEPEDNTDYESLAEMYAGTWSDDKNNLTLFIQPTDEVEHGCLFTIQSGDRLITGTGILNEGMSLGYEEISVNGAVMNSEGSFMLDGEILIWGHDEAAGEFEYGTLFTKLE